MPKKVKIAYSPAAVDDMDEAFSYISQDNIPAAENLLARMDKKIKALSVFPNMGALLSSEDYPLVKPGYRFIVVHPYLIFYRVSGDTVIIFRILHGRRDYLRELFEQI